MNKWEDLRERLEKAEKTLFGMANKTTSPTEASHLLSKIQGIALALDYMRGYDDDDTTEDL